MKVPDILLVVLLIAWRKTHGVNTINASILVNLYLFWVVFNLTFFYQKQWFYSSDEISLFSVTRSTHDQANHSSFFVQSHFLYSKFDAACGDYLFIWQNFRTFCFLFPAFFHVFCSYIDRLWNNIILIFLNFNISIQIIFFLKRNYFVWVCLFISSILKQLFFWTKRKNKKLSKHSPPQKRLCYIFRL